MAISFINTRNCATHHSSCIVFWLLIRLSPAFRCVHTAQASFLRLIIYTQLKYLQYFNNLDFSRQWDRSAPDSTNWLHEQNGHWRNNIENLLSLWPSLSKRQKLFLYWLIGNMLFKKHMQVPYEGDLWTLAEQAKMILQNPVLQKNPVIHSSRLKENYRADFLLY